MFKHHITLHHEISGRGCHSETCVHICILIIAGFTKNLGVEAELFDFYVGVSDVGRLPDAGDDTDVFRQHLGAFLENDLDVSRKTRTLTTKLHGLEWLAKNCLQALKYHPIQKASDSLLIELWRTRVLRRGYV